MSLHLRENRENSSGYFKTVRVFVFGAGELLPAAHRSDQLPLFLKLLGAVIVSS